MSETDSSNIEPCSPAESTQCNIRLYSGDMIIDDFLSLLQSMSFPDDALLMAFTPADFCFKKYIFDNSFISQSDQGRVFSPAGELCWRNIGNMMRVVYLGDKGILSEPSADSPVLSKFINYSNELDTLSPSKRQFILWGERVDTENEWLEQQIPHIFTYPVNTSDFSRGRVALKVEDWSNSAGIPKFSRYYSLIEIEGDKSDAAE